LGLSALTQTQLDGWIVQARKQAQVGRLPGYIPLLSEANPYTIAVQVESEHGILAASGSLGQSFPLMSVVKPFVLLHLLHQIGHEAVFARVGMQPSDQSFHSLTQLSVDRGFPRNPMINSGAIALAALLPGDTGATRCEALRDWLNQRSGSQLVVDQAMLASVQSLGNETNLAIAKHLATLGYLDAVDTALDTYNHICCLSGTVQDLALLGLLLAIPQPAIAPEFQQCVNALMLTCGLYEASGQYAVWIGLPTKSGVSGALLAVVPAQGAIACYSPALDLAGNSVAGLFVVEHLAQALQLSVFSPRS
jgi:glutaminase